MATLFQVKRSGYIIHIIVHWGVAPCSLLDYTNVAGENLFLAACNSEMNICNSIQFKSKCKPAETFKHES